MVNVFACCCFLTPGMDGGVDETLENLPGNSDCDDADITSWVSVCPRGLWKVQQKRMCEGSEQAVCISEDEACMLLLYH